MNTQTPAALSLLDQAVAKMADAVYREFQHSNDPMVKKIASIMDHLQDEKLNEIMEEGNFRKSIEVAVTGIRLVQERNEAVKEYCMARQMAEAAQVGVVGHTQEVQDV